MRTGWVIARVFLLLMLSHGTYFAQVAEADEPEDSAAQIMEHISVSYDAEKHITWYVPRRSDASEPETWIYASLGVRDAGERRLVLNIHRLNGDLWFTQTLRVEADAFNDDIRLDPARHRIDGHSTASGIEETLLMDDQEFVIRRIADAMRASITLVDGKKREPQRFDLLSKDLASFHRIVSLFDAASLPPAQPGNMPGGEPGQHGSPRPGVPTNPRVIPKTRKPPLYPERARRAGVEGRVILYAVVHQDGTVGDLRVARVPAEGLGFEEAAVSAVKKWKYDPGLLGGKPVDVYFTIVVDFFLK